MSESITPFALMVVAAAFGAGLGVAYVFFRRERRGLALEVRSLWERLDAIFYRSSTAISLGEPDPDAGGLRMIDCNEQACRLHGVARRELLARGSILAGETTEQIAGAREWLKAPRAAGVWRGEGQVRRPDGTVVPVSFEWTRVEVGGRELVLSVEVDMTEQRRAQAALKVSEQRFRQIIESANCLLWKARVREVDGRLDWQFDIPRSGLQQRLCEKAAVPFEEGILWRHFTIPEFPKMHERCWAALHSDAQRYQQEFRILVPDETVWLQEEVEVDRVSATEWTLVGVVVDVTRLKQTEAAVRASELKNRLVLEASNDGIWDYDATTQRMTGSERCHLMLGLSAEELPTMPEGWLGRIHPEDQPVAEAATKRLRESGEPGVYQARYRHADGSWRWLMVRTMAVRGSDGGLERVIGSHTDVTELKRNDGELQQSRRLRAIGELVGGIAHEFNNLLTPMLLQTTMMRDGQARGMDLKEQLRPVIDAIMEARDLTQRILTFGRRASLNAETMDLQAAVQDHVELLRHTIDRRVQMKILPAAEPLWVKQNRTDVAQIVINLVLNARDTLLEKAGDVSSEQWVPSIEIQLGSIEREIRRTSAAEDGGAGVERWRVLSVRDNGMGMAEDVRERIFEPFYTTKEVGHGTGLGLATAWHLIKTMGGEVEVETQAGEGSVFRVYLPAVPAPHAAEAVSKATPVVAREGEPVRVARILLADDQREVAGTLSRMLQRRGHQVLVVADGAAALRELALKPDGFDVCITDLNMPGATGFDIVRMIRDQGLPAKVVVIGGYLTAQVRRTLGELKIDAIVPKPFSMDDITAALRACGW